MTVNYNDGKWHGWNGGECPVHPETVVEALWHGVYDPIAHETRKASRLCWGSKVTAIIAFRVVKEHKEPRDFWLCGWNICTKKEAAEKIRNEKHDGIMEIIHVREVMA